MYALLKGRFITYLQKFWEGENEKQEEKSPNAYIWG